MSVSRRAATQSSHQAIQLYHEYMNKYSNKHEEYYWMLSEGVVYRSFLSPLFICHSYSAISPCNVCTLQRSCGSCSCMPSGGHHVITSFPGTVCRPPARAPLRYLRLRASVVKEERERERGRRRERESLTFLAFHSASDATSARDGGGGGARNE